MTVVGARPQFVKAAVVSRALRASGRLEEILVHTGQHYDSTMSEVFFRELQIPPPRHNLNLGPAEPARQLALLLERLGPVMDAEKPDAVLLYGDTVSTLAAALAAAQRELPVIHVEAGERIYRRRQLPEETNRVLTDNLAALNLASTRRACAYLLREGFSPRRVRFVGDPLYDLFLWARPRIEELAALRLEPLGLSPGAYHLATIHRVQNTAARDVLLGLLQTLDASRWPVLMPVHPRVARLLKDWGWSPAGSLRLIEPVGYFDFIRLLLDCRCCFTDSGGASREAFFARRPCVIPMEKCYWPDAVEHGWAVRTGLGREEILEKLDHFTLPAAAPEGCFGDGQAAARIVQEVEAFLCAPPSDDRWLAHSGLADYPPEGAATFSLAAYRALLAALRARGYAFAREGEVESLQAQGRPFVLLRHVLDCAPEKALPLARIEAEAGARATYFVNPAGAYDNIFSPESSDSLRQVLALGHGLGLSCPAGAAPDDARRAAALLEGWFGRPVEAVLDDDRLPCFSDDRGRWQPVAPLQSEAFAEGRPFQLRLHPVWWNEAPLSPNEAVLRLIDAGRDALSRLLVREDG